MTKIKNNKLLNNKRIIKLDRLLKILKRCKGKNGSCPFNVPGKIYSPKKKKSKNSLNFGDTHNIISKYEPLRNEDALIKEPEDYDDISILNRFPKNGLFTITYGYYHSTIFLLEELINNKGISEKDTWIYPILFNFRHYLELILKETLRNFRLAKDEIKYNEVGFESNHILIDLWSDLKPYIDSIEIENAVVDDEQCIIFEERLNEITNIDARSFSFRYPYKGSQSINEKIKFSISNPVYLSLANLKNTMNKMYTFIEGINELSSAELKKRQNRNYQ
jgi:hypothetical protein